MTGQTGFPQLHRPQAPNKSDKRPKNVTSSATRLFTTRSMAARTPPVNTYRIPVLVEHRLRGIADQAN
jgi:hypothetical protein